MVSGENDDAEVQGWWRKMTSGPPKEGIPFETINVKAITAPSDISWFHETIDELLDTDAMRSLGKADANQEAKLKALFWEYYCLYAENVGRFDLRNFDEMPEAAWKAYESVLREDIIFVFAGWTTVLGAKISPEIFSLRAKDGKKGKKVNLLTALKKECEWIIDHESFATSLLANARVLMSARVSIIDEMTFRVEMALSNAGLPIMFNLVVYLKQFFDDDRLSDLLCEGFTTAKLPSGYSIYELVDVKTKWGDGFYDNFSEEESRHGVLFRLKALLSGNCDESGKQTIQKLMWIKDSDKMVSTNHESAAKAMPPIAHGRSSLAQLMSVAKREEFKDSQFLFYMLSHGDRQIFLNVVEQMIKTECHDLDQILYDCSPDIDQDERLEWRRLFNTTYFKVNLKNKVEHKENWSTQPVDMSIVKEAGPRFLKNLLAFDEKQIAEMHNQALDLEGVSDSERNQRKLMISVADRIKFIAQAKKTYLSGAAKNPTAKTKIIILDAEVAFVLKGLADYNEAKQTIMADMTIVWRVYCGEEYPELAELLDPSRMKFRLNDKPYSIGGLAHESTISDGVRSYTMRFHDSICWLKESTSHWDDPWVKFPFDCPEIYFDLETTSTFVTLSDGSSAKVRLNLRTPYKTSDGVSTKPGVDRMANIDILYDHIAYDVVMEKKNKKGNFSVSGRKSASRVEAERLLENTLNFVEASKKTLDNLKTNDQNVLNELQHILQEAKENKTRKDEYLPKVRITMRMVRQPVRNIFTLVIPILILDFVSMFNTFSVKRSNGLQDKKDVLAQNRFQFALVMILATVGLLNTNSNRAPPYPILMLMDALIFGCILIHGLGAMEAGISIMRTEEDSKPFLDIPSEVFEGLICTICAVSVVSVFKVFLEQRFQRIQSNNARKATRAIKVDSFGSRKVSGSSSQEFANEKIITDLYKLFDVTKDLHLSSEDKKWFSEINLFREFKREHVSGWGRICWPVASVLHTRPWEQVHMEHGFQSLTVKTDTSWVAGDPRYMEKLKKLRNKLMGDTSVQSDGPATVTGYDHPHEPGFVG